MELTFIDNACSIISHNGFKILTDPWLSSGAFEGSWYHYPAITTTAQTLPPVDAIYISHLHPDHYDAETLRVLAQQRPDVPIIALDYGENYLHRILKRDGFTQIIAIRPDTPIALGPFKLTLYPPFANDVFHTATIGNIYDSALVFETTDGSGLSFFHGNDNNPTPEAAQHLRQTHGRFTLAQLKYNAASPYPACFMNLSESERDQESQRILERNLNHLANITQILQPLWLMPAAGSFILAGHQHPKNAYLGTCSWDAAAQYVATHCTTQEHTAQATLVMNEHQTFDFSSGRCSPETYTPVAWNERFDYVATHLADVTYPFEHDDMDQARGFIQSVMADCRKELWRQQEKFNYRPQWQVYLGTHQGDWFAISMAENTLEPLAALPEVRPDPSLVCQLDVRLLARILKRQAHWNNAEIGCHIDFWRTPNVYDPDLHVMLSFLHVPYHHPDNALTKALSDRSTLTPTR